MPGTNWDLVGVKWEHPYFSELFQTFCPVLTVATGQSQYSEICAQSERASVRREAGNTRSSINLSSLASPSLFFPSRHSVPCSSCALMLLDFLQPYIRLKLWWVGMVLMAMGETGNFLAYAYAPATVVAPLGAGE